MDALGEEAFIAFVKRLFQLRTAVVSPRIYPPPPPPTIAASNGSIVDTNKHTTTSASTRMVAGRVEDASANLTEYYIIVNDGNFRANSCIFGAFLLSFTVNKENSAAGRTARWYPSAPPLFRRIALPHSVIARADECSGLCCHARGYTRIQATARNISDTSSKDGRTYDSLG